MTSETEGPFRDRILCASCGKPSTNPKAVFCPNCGSCGAYYVEKLYPGQRDDDFELAADDPNRSAR